MAINIEARDLIRARSGVLHAIRETLVGKGFLEVETPILQQIHGEPVFERPRLVADMRLFAQGAMDTNTQVVNGPRNWGASRLHGSSRTARPAWTR